MYTTVYNTILIEFRLIMATHMCGTKEEMATELNPQLIPLVKHHVQFVATRF